MQTVMLEMAIDTSVDSLGPCRVPSPYRYQRFTADSERVLYDGDAGRVSERLRAALPVTSFEAAGPRADIFFDPANTKAAIVNCGGLCPGLNDVVRAIVNGLYFTYGVKRVKGVRYGYAGLNPALGLAMQELTPEAVKDIHQDGGSFLGSSRGPQPVPVMVDTLDREDIRILFCIGGDGTLHGAEEIHQEIKKRGLRISVVGVPKTIDNDILLCARTFGFDTAVGEAVESLRCAHAEATGTMNGVGLVKLMGRESGFVAAHAALAEGDANFVLVPEVPFALEGPRGLLQVLETRVRNRGHALIVVAEGAGQSLFPDSGRDASGNKKLGDIGVLLRDRIGAHFKARGLEGSVKYIDPSYIIRSVPANPNDGVFCQFLGQQAVHAGMAGKTGLLISSWANTFVHVPITSAIQRRKHLNPDGDLWRAVLESTGQPEHMLETP
ncbi:MAG TPA: ATP-dependent 6-phosphofructokinase [Myxococcota bacterium]|nr:ATP-dependent 6-phosphofructokinase [Myxococcota bacterium]HRY96011.1 ATP-dependent 6-phosphofructokinase [Myxococcota bacterium]HSA24433.1 ATP-dependent 6-phosphofructokinase [Myxococcota bacterium]